MHKFHIVALAIWRQPQSQHGLQRYSTMYGLFKRIKMLKIKIIIIFIALLLPSVTSADRIKDLTDIAGVRTNKLIGYGLVVGLQGSGDGKDLPIGEYIGIVFIFVVKPSFRAVTLGNF